MISTREKRAASLIMRKKYLWLVNAKWFTGLKSLILLIYRYVLCETIFIVLVKLIMQEQLFYTVVSIQSLVLRDTEKSENAHA